MEWFIYINAGVGMLALLLACGAFALMAWARCLEARTEARRDERDTAARGHLLANSHWFSEDEPTWALLQNLGDPLLGVEDCRRIWRKMRSRAALKGGE